MSAIIRLYPRAWRERYGDELVALLEDHPASLLDQVDLVRGALDARLHPQVRGGSLAPEKELSVNSRTPALMAAVGGILWIAGIASVFILPRGLDGYRDAGLAVTLLAVATGLIGVALGELGRRKGSAASRRTGRAISIVSLAFGTTLLLGWPVFLIGLLGFPILSGLAAVRGALNAVFPGWLAVVIGVTAVASLAGYFGLGIESDSSAAMIALFGLGALVLAWLAFRSRPGTMPGPTQEPA